VLAVHPELQADAKRLAKIRNFPIWTDDYSNLLGILR